MNNIDYKIQSEDNAKTLSEVFKEIKELRKNQDKFDYDDRDISKFEEESFFVKAEKKAKNRLKRLIAIDLVIMISISFSVFANYIFAFTTEDFGKENVQAVAAVEFEANSSAIDLENVLLENVSILKTKKLVEEPVEVEFETKYIEDENLPLNEEIVVQEGAVGSKNVTEIKTYENSDLVDENVIEEVETIKPVEKIIRIGTSEFLNNNQIHLDDTIYVTDTVALKQSPDTASADIISIPSSLEVVLRQMSGNWCKVEYEGTSGYILSSKLTSAIATPSIIEANRIQKIKLAVSEDMELNKSSGLTLEDFKKILSNNSRDRYGVFTDAAEDFYKADRDYNVNGVFLASIGIHESAWGTSKIARDKKNLFGYGAYDASPYESAFTFNTYYEGIEMLAKSLTKNYLNTAGTILVNGDIATGVYYNGNNTAGVNVRYASDPEWHNKVFKYMQQLYNNL